MCIELKVDDDGKADFVTVNEYFQFEWEPYYFDCEAQPIEPMNGEYLYLCWDTLETCDDSSLLYSHLIQVPESGPYPFWWNMVARHVRKITEAAAVPGFTMQIPPLPWLRLSKKDHHKRRV
jgi:hypothetical protein